jgi:hypothetical protein
MRRAPTLIPNCDNLLREPWAGPGCEGDRPSRTARIRFFFPGAIEISQIRHLQHLERVPDGRAVLNRFMVRGHWRRPPGNWKDQRMRWIRPHWKGPDMAAIIERTYKLKP